MKRLTSRDPWKRRGLQLGLLGGAALAFVGGDELPRVAAEPLNCVLETQCTFKKPLLAFVLDGSTAMNEPFDADSTRWEAAADHITETTLFDNGYVETNFILALLHFGHDPDPNQPGTTIVGDASGLVDGVKLDVPWYDPDDPVKKYIECTNGDAIVAALAALPAPLNGAKTGIGAWTRGALGSIAGHLATAAADHPEDMGERRALVVLYTVGTWTDPTGTSQLAPPEQDPAITAAQLWLEQAIPTHVVAFGGPATKPTADALAAAGGTGEAVDAAAGPQALQGLVDEFKQMLEDIKQDIPLPVCEPNIPRVMILLDASSSMLNAGDARAASGEGSWDQIRDKLAGADPIFDLPLGNGFGVDTEYYFGLAVFGSPSEQRLLVQYAPCRRPHFAWALDPASSCEAPGCTDPYAPPPIAWTFKDGAMVDPPNFGSTTISHMPRCDQSDPQSQACSGSGSHAHLGLQLVNTNIGQYRTTCQAPGAQFECSESTPFLNVMITDGAYDSTDAQVKAPLVAMHGAGVTTHIIGFGDDVDLEQLNKMADWGSGGALDPAIAQTQDQLEAAFAAILVDPVFGPCCSFADCDSFIDTEGADDWGEDGGTTSDGGDTSDDATTTGLSDTRPTTVDPDPDTGASTATDAVDDTGPATATGPGLTTGDGPNDTTGASPTGDEPTPTSGGPGPTGDSASATTSASETESPPETGVEGGCGCRSPGVGATPSLLLLGLLVRRRPRRSGERRPA